MRSKTRVGRALMWTVLALVVAGLGALRAEAQWHTTATGDAIDYNSNGIPTGGTGDDMFQRTLIGGANGVKLDFTFCCNDPAAICLQGDTLGAQVTLTISVATLNGMTDPATTPTWMCCSQCCGLNGQFDESNFSIQGVPGAAWGAPAVQVSVDASVGCICCRNGAWRSETGAGGSTGTTVLNWY